MRLLSAPASTPPAGVEDVQPIAAKDWMRGEVMNGLRDRSSERDGNDQGEGDMEV